MTNLFYLFSDQFLFWFIQCLLLLVVLIALCKDSCNKNKIKTQAQASIKRGEIAMGKFYALYASINGLLVAITLSIDVTDGYRVILIILQTCCFFYLFLLNQFVRNKIIEFSSLLKKIEND